MEKHDLFNRFLFFVVLAMLIVVSLKFSNITGFAVVEKGGTEDLGKQEKNNPNYGALKGTVVFVIKDGNKVISSENAEDQLISFVEKGKTISDWDLVRESSGNYKGELEDVDADGDEIKCSDADYETERKYYDEDNNDQKTGQEPYVYQVTTDDKGCFASRLPPKEYDVYI